MGEHKQVPDVLGFKLVEAEELLRADGWEWTIEEALPYKVPKEFVRHKEDAYILRQSLMPDNKVILLVGYKYGKEA